MKCPYCKGKLKIEDNIRHIDSFEIVCENCGVIWIDEDDIIDKCEAEN